MHQFHWLASALDNPPNDDQTLLITAIQDDDAHWILSLFAHLDHELATSKEISLLRNLARLCVSLVRTSYQRECELLAPKPMIGGLPLSPMADIEPDAEVEEGEMSEDSVSPAPFLMDLSDTDVATGRAACWMILMAVVCVWGQRDLWLEANARLHGTMRYSESVDVSDYMF